MGFLSALFSRKSRASKLARHERRLLKNGTEEELAQYARRLADENKFEQALEVLRRAGDQHPESNAIAELTESIENSVIHAHIGVLQAQLEEQGSPEILARLAEYYRRVNDFATAMKCGREAIEMDNSSPVGYRTVGRQYLDQFRVGQTSVQGINALRYLSKAHSLDPRASKILLNLAEIFVILRAPLAARKFLSPVLAAFPNDPQVIRLEEGVKTLPNEGTSQIQDLFLRHEQRMSGEHPHPAAALELPVDFSADLEKLGAELAGTQGIYLVDAERTVVAGYSTDGSLTAELGESLGVLGDTARQNSQRMGIGSFTRLLVTANDSFVMIDSLSEDVTAFFLGEKTTKHQEVEAMFSRVADLIGTPTGAAQ